MSFYVSPIQPNLLRNWSFSEEVPRSGYPWNGQEVHFVNYVHGIDDSPHRFWVLIEHAADKPVDELTFHLNIVAQYMHHEEHRTTEFKRFVDNFPDYAHVVAYPSYLESWLF